jgi:hypothetical protein
MANRFLIGKGELLTYEIPPPPIVAEKARPYSFDEAKAHLIPQIVETVLDMQKLPQQACPFDVAVAKVDLHPTYIAKSFFPTALLRQAGLVPIGSRTVKVRARKDLRKTAPEECETTRLFLAGTRGAFARLPSLATQLVEHSKEALQFSEFEDFRSMTSVDRIRGNPGATNDEFEVGLHVIPELDAGALLRMAFVKYAKECGFDVSSDFDFPVGRMLFLAARGNPKNLTRLAQFSLLRVVRPMPPIRGARPVMRGKSVAVGFSMPSALPVSDEPRVAILDGGLPAIHLLAPYVRRQEASDPLANDVPDYIEHGLGVTSAFLFGPIEPGGEAARPYAFVDHFRVLDEGSNAENPYELYRTLEHVEDVLLSRQYEFINLSLGPDLPADDDDVHAWTAVLDTMLSDGETLMTVAVGNNGERDKTNRLDRIQVPSDSVNALSVGASDRLEGTWQRASYSATGPGRSPGRRKPDVVAFGGCPKEYFHVATSGLRPELAASMGTSYAAPFALRTAVGIRAVLGEDIHPLTIKALMVHSAEMSDATNDPAEIGWGRIPDDVNQIIMCGDGIARILYQGRLRSGKYLRAPVPLPATSLTGMVTLSATFCYASPVDVEDAAAYTKAGLSITFRPNADKPSGKQAKTRSFFKRAVFRTEQEQRTDLGKWETVMHASERMQGKGLNQATFDIHYNAREGGAAVVSGSELIRYALVLTVRAPKHMNLYEDILAEHNKLKAIEPRVPLPLRVSVGSR